MKNRNLILPAVFPLLTLFLLSIFQSTDMVIWIALLIVLYFVSVVSFIPILVVEQMKLLLNQKIFTAILMFFGLVVLSYLWWALTKTGKPSFEDFTYFSAYTVLPGSIYFIINIVYYYYVKKTDPVNRSN